MEREFQGRSPVLFYARASHGQDRVGFMGIPELKSGDGIPVRVYIELWSPSHRRLGVGLVRKIGDKPTKQPSLRIRGFFFVYVWVRSRFQDLTHTHARVRTHTYTYTHSILSAGKGEGRGRLAEGRTSSGVRTSCGSHLGQGLADIYMRDKCFPR